MDIDSLGLLVLIAAATAVLLLVRRLGPDDDEADAAVLAMLRPRFDAMPDRPILEQDEAVRWRVELARPRSAATGAAVRPAGTVAHGPVTDARLAL